MKYMNKTILLVFLGILLLSGLSFAAVRFFAVNGTNSATAAGTGTTGCQFDDGPDNDLYTQNHSTLQWAINNAFILMAATPGDTVDITVCYNDSNVLNGIDKYNGGIIVNASVFIHSAIMNVIIFNATDTSSTGYVFNITAHGVNISNLMIRDATGGSGIFLNSSNHTFDTMNVSNCSKNINLWKADNNNFTTMGSMNATAYNFFLNYSHNSSFTHVRVHNSTSIGIGMFSSNNTLIFNNSVYWNLHSGIYMENANFTRIINCTFDNNSNSANNGGAINSFFGRYENVSNSWFRGNYRDIAFSNTTLQPIISNNSANNATVCTICLYDVNFSIAFDNNMTNNTYYGILLSASTGGRGSAYNTFGNIRTYNNTQYGIYVNQGWGNVLYNVTSWNNTLDGFDIYASIDNNVTACNASYNLRHGFFTSGMTNSTNFTRNIAQNNSYGFNISGGTTTIFTANNISNNSGAGVTIDDDGSLTFSGNNNFLNYTGNEVFANNGTINTNSFNITTAYLNLELASTYNVTIKIINFSNPVDLMTVSSVSGAGTVANGRVMYSMNGYNHWVNVKITQGRASFAPTFYYNYVNASGLTQHLGVGSTTSGLSWTTYTSTGSADAERYYVRHGGIGISGHFAPMSYMPFNTTGESNSGSSKTYVKISSTAYDCKTKKLTVTLSENLNSGTLKLIDETSPYVDTSSASISGGKAVFIISEASTYKIIDYDLPSTYVLEGYVLEEITSSEFACGAAAETPVTTTTACTSNTDCASTEYCKADSTCGSVTGTCGYATNHAWIAYECCDNSDCGVVGETCKEHYCVAEGEQPPISGTITKEMALTAISTADTAISTATKAGKDATEAKKKLNDANAELTKGDYAKAQLLAAEAEALAKSAKPKTEETTTTTTTTTTPETPATPPKPGFDMGLIGMVLGGLVVIVIAGVAVYFLTKKKSGPGSYKGTSR